MPEAFTLERLGRRLIDLDNLEGPRPGRLAVGKRVQPGPEEDVLPHASLDGLRQLVLGETTAHHEEGPCQPFEGLLEVGFLGTDVCCRGALHEADSHRIIKDLGMGIEDLMRSAQDGRDDRGVTGLSLWHGAASSDFFSASLDAVVRRG